MEMLDRMRILALFCVSALLMCVGAQGETNVMAQTNGVSIEIEEDLSALSVDKLKEKLADIESRIEQASKDIVEMKKEALAMRQRARQTNENVRAIIVEIESLKKKIETTLDEVPEIKARRDGVETSKNSLVALGKARQKILKLIAATSEDGQIEHTQNH